MQGTPRRRHSLSSAALSSRLSIRSTTRSTARPCSAPSPSKRARTLPASTKSMASATEHCGLILRSLCLSTVVLNPPTVSLSAWSCRFVFEMQRVSRSTSESLPTPLLPSASAAQPPTPPTPTNTTWDWRSFASPVRPYSRATPPNRRSKSLWTSSMCARSEKSGGADDARRGSLSLLSRATSVAGSFAAFTAWKRGCGIFPVEECPNAI
mmetsp:Transcript_35391/g.79834  ORF Transcript_35391/g.79834 Transcript_35391/m.79834 type:complete len:210 (-) Transcript_35391:304-933(-)